MHGVYGLSRRNGRDHSRPSAGNRVRNFTPAPPALRSPGKQRSGRRRHHVLGETQGARGPAPEGSATGTCVLTAQCSQGLQQGRAFLGLQAESAAVSGAFCRGEGPGRATSGEGRRTAGLVGVGSVHTGNRKQSRVSKGIRSTTRPEAGVGGQQGGPALRKKAFPGRRAGSGAKWQGISEGDGCRSPRIHGFVRQTGLGPRPPGLQTETFSSMPAQRPIAVGVGGSGDSNRGRGRPRPLCGAGGGVPMSTGTPVFSGPPALPLGRRLLARYPTDPAASLRCEQQAGAPSWGREGRRAAGGLLVGGMGEAPRSLRGAGTRLSLPSC